MSVYEYEIKNASDHMIFFELKKALHTYLQDTAIKAFEAVLNLDLKEFNVLKWLFNQNTFRDVKRAYKEHAQEDKFCYMEEKNIPCTPPGTKQPFEIELFGRHLSEEEKKKYFRNDTRLSMTYRPVHTNKKIKGRHGNKKNPNKNKHTAYNVREQIQTRIHAPCTMQQLRTWLGH